VWMFIALSFAVGWLVYGWWQYATTRQQPPCNCHIWEHELSHVKVDGVVIHWECPNCGGHVG